jgi:hypothetical protein
MGVPGQAAGNGPWRLIEHMLSDSPFKWLVDLTRASQRFESST